MLIPAGYLAKKVALKPDWIKADQVADIYSVSNCISKDFADHVTFWKHNGYWLFDSPIIMVQLAKEHSLDIRNSTMFYYEVYEKEYDENKGQWLSYGDQLLFDTNVHAPDEKILVGFDVVTFTVRSSPECSPLSCCSLATEIQTNAHCLLHNFETAKQLIETGRFNNSEPGPYRIYAVYTV